MKLSARDQVIVGAMLTVLAAAAVFVLLILPRFGEIQAAERELGQIRAEQAQVEAVLGARQDAKARAAETQVALLDIASRFPEAPELPALIIELQDIANKMEIDFIQLAPGRPEPIEDSPVSVIPISVMLNGTWDQYIDFMAALQGLRRAVRVADFSVNSVPPETETTVGTAAEEDGETTSGGSSADDEPDMFTISARVGVVVYMMNSEISVPSGGEAEGTPEGGAGGASGAP